MYRKDDSMMDNRNSQERLKVAASQNIEEKKYWLTTLAGELEKIHFPYDRKPTGIIERNTSIKKFKIENNVFSRLQELSNHSEVRLYMILAAQVMILLNKYTGQEDIIIGSPVYKQESERELINTVVALRQEVAQHIAFRELLIQVRNTIVNAIKNYSYPLEILLEDLKLPNSGEDFPLFDVVVLLENIHEKRYFQHINNNVTFSFLKTGEFLEVMIEYNSALYETAALDRIARHFCYVQEITLDTPELTVGDIDILSEIEKKELLIDFNDTKTQYPRYMTIHELFSRQVVKQPDKIAVVYEGRVLNGDEDYHREITYGELDKRAEGLAGILRSKGVERGSIVGVMLEPSFETMLGILGVLKAGGAYLPIDPENPKQRLELLMADSNISVLLTDTQTVEKHSFGVLQGLNSITVEPRVTSPREAISDFDDIPFPNRSLVNYEKYNRYLDLGVVRYSMSLQATRGCPYKCVYCHKIWHKIHVARSAEKIFEEVKIYYDMGVRRFAFIDDTFNLKVENSRRVLELFIKHGLDIHLSFPNGLRGDILSREYIDILAKAGTIHVALALETASPRLQKLIKKNLHIEKFHENLRYICEKYPQVITGLFTMHGFPTETEEEAMMTLGFIKSLKWIHFPHINVLKIYPGSEVEKIAVENGIPPQAIQRSVDRGYNQLPDTLPFSRGFSLKYQADFLGEYFLCKERLAYVINHQMRVLTEEEMVLKYNSYLPNKVKDFAQLLNFLGIERDQLEVKNCLDEASIYTPGLNRKLADFFPAIEPDEHSLRVLLLDLSQFLSEESEMVEPPLGLMYLMTYLYQQFGTRIKGRIAKSFIDFNNFAGLKQLLEEFKPDVIGMRTLSFYKNFLHETVQMIRLWGIKVPIIAGGPYATSEFKTLLTDGNIDLVVLGEGEITFSQLIGEIIKNDKKMPGEEVLENIPGIAFVSRVRKKTLRWARDVIVLDKVGLEEPGYHTGLTKTKGVVNKPASYPQARDLAYIIYTSGSTGTPKGVMVEHGNVIRLVKNNRFIDFREGDRILQTGVLEFDASTFEIWGALLNGLPLYLLDRYQLLDAGKLKKTTLENDITIMWLTSPLFNKLMETDIEIFSKLHYLLVGGDVLSPFHINKLRERYPGLKVVNGYGPTENTTFSTTHMVNCRYEINIPIGKPISNSTAYILDRNNRLVPIGVVGELCVGGDGVARGYLNNPELTAERFDHHLWDYQDYQDRNHRSHGSYRSYIYKTGDLARWLPQGIIEFLGRKDRQVKIRGFRVELDEIENHLLQIDDIKDAVVIELKRNSGESYLSAYFLADQSIDAGQLKVTLSEKIPDFMVPTFFTQMNEFPLTTNGKVDRKALPDPERKVTALNPPKTKIEKQIAAAWGKILKLENLGLDDNFFEIGGNSIDIVHLQSEIKEVVKKDIPIIKLFEYPTIRSFSHYLSEAGPGGIGFQEQEINAWETRTKNRNRDCLKQKRELMKKER